MKKNKIFIACDTKNIKKIKKILKYTENEKINFGYKFGLEFFYSTHGRSFIKKLKNKQIFLDLKLNDIPNTCGAAVESLADVKNIKYITAHINGGYKMLKKIKKKSKKIKILGITVLTSIDNSSLKEIGFNSKIKDIVIKQAKLAKKAGIDGIVCSPWEVPYIKKICKKMEIVTPGIRFNHNSNNDQKRVMQPNEAFNRGATSIVIGRSLTIGNLKNNFKILLDHLYK